MSVDLVNAQMAEAWQVQRKRWKPQLRQEESTDGQSSEVLKNQHMLHIMSENEKGLSYSLGANQFTDLTKEERESTHLGYKPQNVSKLVATGGRFHYDGGIPDLPSACDWFENSVEVITPVKNQGQCGSCWYLSLIGDEQVISLQRTRSTSFQILYCVLVRYTRTHHRTMHGKTDWDASPEYRNFDRIDGDPMDFEWNISQDSRRCSSVTKSKASVEEGCERHQRISQEESYSCRCSTTSPVDQETMKKNACQMPISFLYMQKDLEKDNGHLLVLVLRKKWYSISEDSPQGEWDKMAERMLLELAESGCPIFRATSPLSRGRLKSKGHGKLSIHYSADFGND